MRTIHVTEAAEGVVLAAPIGDVDLASAPRMLDRLLRVLRDAPPVLVLALDQIEFMDSSGLNALVAVHRRAEVMGTAMRVAAPSPVVRKLFHVTGLDRHFDCFDTVKDALTASGE